MLSFGIDASLALRTAFSSVALAAGSPPPSRAATVIARVSLENCAPRRESTTAFLCLMLDHFECPDIRESLRSAATDRRPGTLHRRSPRRMQRHMAATVSPDIFKAYDVRGLYGEQIDGDLAERIGRGFAQVLSKLEGMPTERLRVGL